MRRSRSIHVTTLLVALATVVSTLGLAQPARTAAAETAGALDFGDQLVGTTSSPPLGYPVPLRIRFADLPAAAILLAGDGGGPVDTALAALGLPSPLTAGALAAAYPAGAVHYTVAGLGLDAGAASDFVLDPGDCPGASGASQPTCSASLAFRPTALGLRTDIGRAVIGGLAFENAGLGGFLANAIAPFIADLVSDQLAIALSGTGIGGLTSDRPGLAFEPTVSGATTPARTLSLTNRMPGPVQVGTADLGGSADFVIGPDGCSGTTLAQGASCTLGVAFSPTAVGPLTATLRLTHDGIASPLTVDLSGTGLPPFSISPASLDFGGVIVGATSPGRTVTLTNTGPPVLHVGALDAGSADFSIGADGCTGAALAEGASCTFEVAFGPTGLGPQGATLRVVHDRAGSPATVGLAGNGLIAFGVSPTAHDFGPVLVGTTSAAQTISLTNAGPRTLHVGPLELGGAAASFRLGHDGCSGAALATGASCTVEVAFHPTASAIFAATLSLASDAAGSPAVVTLAGLGTAAAGTAGALDFGDQLVGTTSNPPLGYPVPLRIRFADLPPAAVLLAGDGGGPIDTALAALGLPSPLTAGALAAAYPAGAVHYTVAGLGLDAGAASDFVLDPGDCPGASGASQPTCSASLAFRPTALGLRTDIGRAVISGLAFENAGLGGFLANAIAPFIADLVSDQLAIALSGTGIGGLTTLRWSDPPDIVYGTGLGTEQLDATASVPGTFTYSPSAGAVLSAGTHILSVQFTPTDQVHFSAASTTVSIMVRPAPLTVSADPKSKAYGSPNPPFTATIGGFVNGDTASSAGLSGAPSCTTTAVTGSPVTVAGYPIACTQGNLTVGQNYVFATFRPATLTITTASLAVTATSLVVTLGETIPSPTAVATGLTNGDTLASLGITVSVVGPVSAAVPGVYPIVVSVPAVNPPPALANYAVQATNGTLTTRYRICLLYDPDKASAGKVVPIKLYLCDAAAIDRSSDRITVTALAIESSGQPAKPIGGSAPGNLFTFSEKLGPSGGYQFNLDMSVLASFGPYTLTFRVSTDAPGMLQGAPFRVR